MSSLVLQPAGRAPELRRTPRGHRALATAGMLFLALLGSSLKLHSDLPHGHDSGASEALVFADARHPEAPLHLEAANSVALRHCNTCLLQRDQVHGALPVPALLAGVAPTTTAFGSLAGAPRSQPRAFSSARGPPVV